MIWRSERPTSRGGEAPWRSRRGSAGARRAAFALLFGTIATLLIVRVGATAIRPLVVSFQVGRDVRRLESDLHRQRQRRARLLQAIAYLRTPAGVEEEARRQGWVREGETAIQVIRPQDSDPTPDQAPDRGHQKAK